MDLDVALALEAEKKFGVFTLEQAKVLGFTYRMVERRVQTGRWRKVSPRVFVMTGVPYTWHADVTAATMATAPRSAACRGTAAAAHGLMGFKPNTVEVVTGGGVRMLPRASIFRSQRFDEDRTVVVNGVRCTDLARTLLDVGATNHPAKVGMALDAAVAGRRIRLARLHLELAEAGRGYPGSACLRKLLATRPEGYVPPTPGLARRLDRIIKKAGLPPPVREFEVKVKRATYYLDFAYPEHMIGIEAHSYEYHEGGHFIDYDAERHNRLTTAGWRMLYNTHWRAKHRPDELVDELFSLLAA